MGPILKNLRGKLTVKDVASRIGTTPATVYAWEAGTKLPSPDPLQKLLDHVRANPEKRLETWESLAQAHENRSSNRPVGIEQAAA